MAPHMLILDPSMPNLQGIEVIRKVKTLYPDVKVLVLRLHKDKEYLNQAISHGAEGYLPKEDMDKEALSRHRDDQGGESLRSPLPLKHTRDVCQDLGGETRVFHPLPDK